MTDNFYGPEDMAEYYRMTKPNILAGGNLTNANRIRSMTDEELATWIYMNRWNDIESLLEWLRQEAVDKDSIE